MEHGFTIKDGIFLIFIACAIVALFSAVITVQKNADALKNPMGTCMAQFDINHCLCYDMYGGVIPIKSINYNETADENPFKPEWETQEYKFNFSQIKFGDDNGTGRIN